MSATGNPSSSSLPSRYSRVRAWHRVGLTSAEGGRRHLLRILAVEGLARRGRDPSAPPRRPGRGFCLDRAGGAGFAFPR